MSRYAYILALALALLVLALLGWTAQALRWVAEGWRGPRLVPALR
jgi:hypothetical protein